MTRTTEDVEVRLPRADLARVVRALAFLELLDAEEGRGALNLDLSRIRAALELTLRSEDRGSLCQLRVVPGGHPQCETCERVVSSPKDCPAGDTQLTRMLHNGCLLRGRGEVASRALMEALVSDGIGLDVGRGRFDRAAAATLAAVDEYERRRPLDREIET